jgi:hypothetical protein
MAPPGIFHSGNRGIGKTYFAMGMGLAVAAGGYYLSRPTKPVEPIEQTKPPVTGDPLSPLALVPREPFGLPLVAWIGGAIYLFMLLLILGSML